MMHGTIPPLGEDEFPDLGNAVKTPLNGHAATEQAQTNGAGPQEAACRIRFTVFTAGGKRLAKLYKLADDGSIKAEFRPEFSTGGYYVANTPAGTPREALKAFGAVIDQFPFDCAIGLGVPLNGTGSGTITTKKRKAAGKDPDAITRTLEYFGWPDTGLLLLDGDDIDGLFEILCELYPPFKDVAFLSRPSASASIQDPKTGKALKRGEHGYCVLDEPDRSKEVLKALIRLAWCKGSNEACGFLKLSAAGSILPPYGPVDTTVGSAERVSYEGANVTGKGVKTLPRVSVGHGGHGMLCAEDLIAYADEQAPEAEFLELVEAEKVKPEFIAKRDALRGAHRETHVKAAVKRGLPREKVEKAYDQAVGAGERTIGERTYLPLTDEHVLYWPNGRSFTVADIKSNRAKFHGKECADPDEGLNYKSSNPGIIYCDGSEIVIYSRAHGDAFAYVAPMEFDNVEWAELMSRVMEKRGISPVTGVDEDEDEDEDDEEGEAAAAPSFQQAGPGKIGVAIIDFYAYMPKHNYIFAPTGEIWVPSSVDSRVPKVPLKKKNGEPVRDENGKKKYQRPARWLDKNRPVEQMTWAPGFGVVVKDYLISEGGWFYRKNCNVFNLYKPPVPIPASTEEPTMWLDHIHKIYPNDADHIIPWLAHRVQKPEEKLNHALVLGGNQGIGKDTILEPVKRAVGAWNFIEVSPQQILGRFNGHLKSVVLRISEARDLGSDFNRFSFYDHTKAFIAAPPDVLRVDEKHKPEHSILNVVGVIITTNHKSDGIFLPADDRRHYVAWSKSDKSQFDADYWNEIWKWYDSGGIDIVANYLINFDLEAAGFNPKAPPPQTPAFWEIVNASRSTEDAELADAMDELAKQIETARLKKQNAEAASQAGEPDETVETVDEDGVVWPASMTAEQKAEKARLDEQTSKAKLEWPNAVTIDQVKGATKSHEFREYLGDRRNSRKIPYRFEACGYTPVRNSDAKDGLWKLNGRRQVIYAKTSLGEQQRQEFAKAHQ